MFYLFNCLQNSKMTNSWHQHAQLLPLSFTRRFWVHGSSQI